MRCALDVSRDNAPQGTPGHWRVPVSTLASALFVVSCVGSGQGIDSRSLTLASGGESSPRTAETVTRDEAPHPPTTRPLTATEEEGSAVDRVSALGTSAGGRGVSLRPRNNVDADDLLDHWGHRRIGILSAPLTESPAPGEDVAELKALLEAARGAETGPVAPDLRDDDTVAVLGHRRGVTYGRWSGGPADTLSIDFDYRGATSDVRYNRPFKAALERAGKAWSRRIADTWAAWERAAGESKARLIGDDGADGKEILVGAGGERPAPASSST